MGKLYVPEWDINQIKTKMVWLEKSGAEQAICTTSKLAKILVRAVRCWPHVVIGKEFNWNQPQRFYEYNTYLRTVLTSNENFWSVIKPAPSATTKRCTVSSSYGRELTTTDTEWDQVTRHFCHTTEWPNVTKKLKCSLETDGKWISKNTCWRTSIKKIEEEVYWMTEKI